MREENPSGTEMFQVVLNPALKDSFLAWLRSRNLTLIHDDGDHEGIPTYVAIIKDLPGRRLE